VGFLRRAREDGSAERKIVGVVASYLNEAIGDEKW